MFDAFTSENLLQIIISVILAFIPVVIWFGFLFKGRKTSRVPHIVAFYLGCMTVIPILLLDNLWTVFPVLDVYKHIDLHITDVHFAAFAALVFVGISEEMAKSMVVRFIDFSKIKIQTVNDSIRYAILAGLGFSFIENLFYFVIIWTGSGLADLIFPMIFRSMFTVTAHIVFSGIFGYYYGISKFAKPLIEAQQLSGESVQGMKFMKAVMGKYSPAGYGQYLLLKGMFIAMILHALFDFFLEFELFLPVMIIVLGGFGYLIYLLSKKASALVYAGIGRPSSMSNGDQDVVLELLGMWTQQGKHKDVIDICQRLLMRDPDNKVVQLFLAQAVDKQKLAMLERSIMALFQAGEDKVVDKSMRTLVRQKVLMDLLKEQQEQNHPSSQPNNPAPQPAPST